ncbi:ABC transporter permease [Frankia sp. CNm7]|uniref:ABC transporter permease n=1 Tax=Frankia nepalensis TaxID=1836974 RepID=A0A937RQ74_9ACTN|nr:ABC transporter permease [Frankia nepalensis]MBL7496034.1 ABC transporter permease [Frankia nepalensis]MBL7511845.1 ABC transporter permease [Frankia nepalensis]MBL7517211.1 ABC transporter permease [Frankia nepalensis]MBL7630638.1 ABC transporter permease [Frankia nepalensis]
MTTATEPATSATGPATRSVPAPPSAARIARARAVLELRLYVRARQAMIFSFFYPIIMLVIFGSISPADTVEGGVTYVQYFTAGIAATGIILNTFQQLGIRIANERDAGELARLQALGTPAISYLAGKAAQVLVTTVAQLALLVMVARFAFDVPLPVDAAHWLTFAWVTLLGTLAGTALGFAVSLLPKSAKNADTVIVPIALILQFFSGVFFVYSSLPGWMQAIASVFPLKWLTQGMRSVFLPDAAASAEVAGSWEHGLTALILAAWVVVGVAVCARRFRWRRPA